MVKLDDIIAVMIIPVKRVPETRNTRLPRPSQIHQCLVGISKQDEDLFERNDAKRLISI